jgi:hypothetical protein
MRSRVTLHQTLLWHPHFSRHASPVMLLACFAMALAWHATARAQDILERGTSFHIAASPLSSALIDFSTQSGLQVAAADADVAHLNSNGVNGTFPPRVALDMLLHGTGLGFSRVGATTIAIGTAPKPTLVASTHAGGSGGTARTPEAKPPQPDPNETVSPDSEIPDVTVTAPRPPTNEELAGDSLSQFIVHHATVHYFNSSVTGNLAHWRGGQQSICPVTAGLAPDANAFVTARLRALAAHVGAPAQSNPQCQANVRILFTAKPQEIMDDVVNWASVYFRRGAQYAQRRRLIAFTGDHAIQGWYLTTGGGARALNTELALLPLNLLPVWPQITPRTGGGDTNGIGAVILVIDTNKVGGYGIGAVADYLSMLTLSLVQSPDNCDPLPSILDLMSSSCGTREKPTAMTAGDLAFLKALYYRNTGLGSSLSRSEIQDNMNRQFKVP